MLYTYIRNYSNTGGVIHCSSINYSINTKSQSQIKDICDWDFVYKKMFVSINNSLN